MIALLDLDYGGHGLFSQKTWGYWASNSHQGAGFFSRLA